MNKLLLTYRRWSRLLPVCLMLLLSLTMAASPVVRADSGCSDTQDPTASETVSGNKLSCFDYNAIYGNWESWIPLSDEGTCSSDGTSSSTDTTLSGSDNVEKTWNFFKGKGFSDTQTAAIVGNIQDESSSAISPTIMQKGGFSKNPNDAGDLGWGIVQWSPGGKIIGIAKDLGITTPIYELGTQLNIVYKEMQGTSPTGDKNMAAGLKKVTDIADAVEFFRANFEGGITGSRLILAKKALAQYGGTSSDAGTTGQDPVSGTDASSCSSAAAVDCTPTGDAAAAPDAAGALSSTRQKVVCLAQAEYQKYKTGEMKPGTDFYKYSLGANEEWCADFVSWVYNSAGYPLSDAKGGKVAAVLAVQDIGQKGGKFNYHSVSGYTPVPGDLAIHIFGSGGHHVNMVVSVNTNKKQVTLIGGNESGTSTANTSSRVNQSTMPYNGDSIVGYVSPSN